MILMQGCVLTALSVNHCTYRSVETEFHTFIKSHLVLGNAHQQFQVSRQTGR